MKFYRLSGITQKCRYSHSETHIYRLRKKIQEKFLDNNFILNNKDGYYL